MIDYFFVFGVASLQLLPIFTLIYLQNEILFINIQSKFLCIIAMVVSFILIFINILLIEQTIQILSSILLIITLSLSINYTYKDYTIDEGYYITIPYFIIYSCFVFVISINESPVYMIESSSFYIMLLCLFICYILFSMNIYLGIEFHRSYFNYIAFLGLVISTFNVILIINSNEQMKFSIQFLVLQFIHIYLYLTHLLSVQFELNMELESNIFNKK